ncbi:MAG: protein kinase [bacterium]|nr:protein kinase [bacterium]
MPPELRPKITSLKKKNDAATEGVKPRTLTSRPFISRLPQTFLKHGAQAVLGHTDRGWALSLSWALQEKPTDTVRNLENSLKQLLKGQRVGHAMRTLYRRYTALAAQLVEPLERIRSDKEISTKSLAMMWAALNDARNFIIIGDPCVRPLGGNLHSALRRDYPQPVEMERKQHKDRELLPGQEKKEMAAQQSRGTAKPKTWGKRVFISYSHDSEEHKKAVRALSDRLRKEGVDCEIDQYELAPPQGWPRWAIHQIEKADFILVVCTEIYNQRLRGGGENGKGVQWEGVLLTDKLYSGKLDFSKCIPVVFSEENIGTIPTAFRSGTYYDLREDSGYEKLYRHLTDQPEIVRPILGSRRVLDALAPREAYPRTPLCGPNPQFFLDDENHRLSEKLGNTYRRFRDLSAAKHNTADVESEILDLQRQLREGDQLRPGDFMALQYRLIKLIGSGSTGTVWRAHDVIEDRSVAVKAIHSHLSHDRQGVNALFDRIGRVAGFAHGRIVKIIRKRVEDGRYHFFVMEYVSGSNLAKAVQERRLGFNEKIDLLTEIGEALHFAHENNTFHGNLKPGNILIDENGEPKLLDLGCVFVPRLPNAKNNVRMANSVIFTAPELMNEKSKASVRSDLYSLGMTAIFLVQDGSLPFEVLRDPTGFSININAPRASPSSGPSSSPSARP